MHENITPRDPADDLHGEPPPAPFTPRRVNLVVDFMDGTTGYYEVSVPGGWRVHADLRMIRVGRGLERTMIPLDNVRSFTFQEQATETSPPGVTWNAEDGTRVNGAHVPPPVPGPGVRLSDGTIIRNGRREKP